MYQQYINGKLVDGLGKPLDVLDPSTGEVVGTVGSANAAQAQQALDAAAEAFKTWSKTPLQTRIDWMLKQIGRRVWPSARRWSSWSAGNPAERMRWLAATLTGA